MGRGGERGTSVDLTKGWPSLDSAMIQLEQSVKGITLRTSQ